MSRPRRSAFTSTFVVEHHFTGFGQVSASLNLLTWLGARTSTLRLGTAVLVLPWHNPVLLGRAGRDPRPAVRRPARFRRRQGLSLERVRRLLRRDGGGRRALRRGDGRHHQVLRLRRAVQPSRQILAIRQHRRRAALGNAAASAVLDGRRQRALGAAGRRARLQPAARPVRPRRGRHPARRAVQGGCREARPPLRPDGGRRRARDPLRRHARRNWKPPRSAASRAMSGSTTCRAAPTATTATASRARTRQRCAASATRPRSSAPRTTSRRKLEALRDGGVEYVLINFGGSRENIRRFAREIMPAFADAPRDKQARDGQAMAVAAK